jgi:hypothetical protein
MLRDLRRVTDRDESLEAGQLKQAAARMLKQQFLLRERAADREPLRLVSNHFEYFENLFDALGWDLHRDDDFGFIGILPTEQQSHARLKLIDTLLALCLRLFYEEGMDRFEVRDGGVFIDSNTLLERYETLFSGRRLPAKGEFREVLGRLRRRSLIETGESDDQGLPRLRILPTIRLVTGPNVIERIETFCADSVDEEEDPDMSPDDEEAPE